MLHVVTIGQPPDARYYEADMDARGNVVRVRVGFYGYRGALTYRELKRDGPAWRRVVAHLKEKKL